jgi:hypothetical protein
VKGQSVRAYVSSVTEEGKANLSLKPSLTNAKDSLLLESHFHDQSLLANASWGAEFVAGTVVQAEVVAHEAFGVLASVRTADSTVVNALAISAQVQLKPKVCPRCSHRLLLLKSSC